MLRSYFRRVRMQPKAVRDRHALIIATLFTSLIAGVWGFTHMRFDTEDRRQIDSETQPPFSGLINQVKDQWATVEKTIPDEIKDAVATTTPETMQLNEANREQLRQSIDEADSWQGEAVASSSTVSRPVYEEVQIVTVSASTTASSTERVSE